MRILPLAWPEAGKILFHEQAMVLEPFPTVKEDEI